MKKKNTKRLVYQDNVEGFLETFFNQPETKKTKEIYDLLANNPTWPTLYHLSPQRRMILEWYDFKPSSTLLEIGAGCGAITKIFLQKCKVVTCLELEKKRANILKKRFADFSNLNIFSGDLAKFTPRQKFDYVTLIGVLEYAGRFFDNSDTNNYSYQPFLEMLNKSKEMLLPNGKIFIAIENKLGLKYISGCPEDHYGSMFESFEDYPHYNGIRTFSKFEIRHLLKKTGFKKIQFFYPYPDYKFPTQIYSRRFLLNHSVNVLSLFPTVNPSSERKFLINETMMAKTLIDARLLDQFSNSFLVVAQK